MADKPKKDIRTSPRGVLVYPSLTKPDTKFDAEGVYKTRLLIADAAEAKRQKDTIDALTEQAVEKFRAELTEKADRETDKAKAKKLREKAAKLGTQDAPYTYDEEEGTISLSFKMKASGKTREGKAFTQKPHLFNAVGQPIKGVLKVGGGTVAKVGYEVVLYYNAANNVAGVSLRLKAVQVIELVEWGGASASTFGFGEEAGGFAGTGEDEPAEDREEESEEEQDDSDGDF